MLHGSPAKVILLDIEGTTTPIDFVYKTLFPYARRRLEEFLRCYWAEPGVQSDIDRLRKQYQFDTEQKLQPPVWADDSRESRLASALAYAQWLMDRDSKTTALKSLQGKIWQEGYRSGELHGEVFSDVPPALARWSQQQKKIGIFSSGSVLAQMLLFSSTTSGDLTRFIAAYFDTAIGAKTEPESYRKIAASLGLTGPEVVFISDTVRELDAARKAGMETALCARSKNQEANAAGYLVIHTFDEIFP